MKVDEALSRLRDARDNGAELDKVSLDMAIRALEIRQRMVERQEELRYKENRSEAEKAEYCALIALQF